MTAGRPHAIGLAVWALLGGCAVAPTGEKVALDMPAQWSNAPADGGVAGPSDLAQWWKGFADPVLDGLIARALAANHDLKAATERVREARAMARAAGSVLLPTLDAGVTGGREKQIDRAAVLPGARGMELTLPTADAVSADLTLAWEVDVFGGNRLRSTAASAQARAAEEGRRAVQVALLAQVAGSYLQLRGAQRLTATLSENIALQGERLRLLEAYRRAGLASELDIARQQALLRTTEAALPGLTEQTATLIHRLAVLLGERPADLATPLGLAAPLPRGLPQFPALMPSDLLAQRPDLRRARLEVTAAAASLGAAHSDLFPKFLLSASVGIGSLALGGVPGIAETVYALGSGLTAPIFNGGRIRAGIEAADARLGQVAADYEKAFLTALEEVEDAFVAHASALARRDEMTKANAAARRAERLAAEFYQRGVTGFLDVLDTQRARLASDEELTRAETAVAVSMVSLYRAFGGGWEATPAAPSPVASNP